MWVPLSVIAAALIMMASEHFTSARQWPTVRDWLPRAFLLSLLQAIVVGIMGLTFDPWFAAHRLGSLHSINLLGGAVLGYVSITFVYYFWHRARHEVPMLWRLFHQIHHSPQRLETITSFYKHPLEIAFNGLLSSGILYVVLGLPVASASLAILFTGIAELFYHWNVATPHWIGYIIQRPESHCLHHQDSGRRVNYADLPLWDWLFGTFENPIAWDGRCGFGERESELGAMLLGIDVNESGGRQ